MEHREIVVVAAGAGPSRVPGLPGGALVIAADGGLDRCRALGLVADVVVGDLDSVTTEALEAAAQGGAEIVRHPARKDATDLELALDVAVARGARRIVVVASAEGRLDHLLSSLLLLGHERYAGVELEAHLGDAVAHVIRDDGSLHGEPGDLVTLLALGGPAAGVTTDGLEYPLTDETLAPGSSRGVSNVLSGTTARVAVHDGVLLAVLPGGES